MDFANGDKHIGGFREGKKNGHGTSIFADGTKRIGVWADGKLLEE